MKMLTSFFGRIVFKFRGEILTFSKMSGFDSLEGVGDLLRGECCRMHGDEDEGLPEGQKNISELTSLLCHSLPSGLSFPVGIQITALPRCTGKHHPEKLG